MDIDLIGLSIVIVGEDPASQTYVKMKEKACEYVGISSSIARFPENTKEKELISHIDKLNHDRNIHGILVQLPLPKHISENVILQSIYHKKDVDGFTHFNSGALLSGTSKSKEEIFHFTPATPLGVIRLLKEYNIDLKSKNIAIIGTSNIVGKPLASLFLKEHSTVSMCNVNTVDVSHYTKYADIVCIGIGVPRFLKADMIKDGAIIIDIGINAIDGKIVGDVDFEEVSKKASYISPVPGGVGPMTISMLLENTLKSAKNK